MTEHSGPEPDRPFGFVEWFRRGEHARAQQALRGMHECGATFLRTHLSWAEYYADGGQEWYDWLIPTLGKSIDLLPCVHYTPPSISRTGRASGPPHRLKDYADFIDVVLTRYGDHFSHIELWNEPNNLLDWDWREDPDWAHFCEMIGGAAYWAEHRGWRAVLGGPCPLDTRWLDLMGERGVLGTVSAVGIHGFPGTWDSEEGTWSGWADGLASARRVIGRYNPSAEVWITEAGYSTWRQDDAAQVARFRDALASPADRLYWYGWQDVPRAVPVQEGLYFDPRHYHLGVTDARGRPKLLRRLMANRMLSAPLARPYVARSGGGARPALVVGGAGFIGSNLADALLSDGQEVIVYDSLARPGVERNLAWLRSRHPHTLHVALADIRDETSLGTAVGDASAVYHFAAQVAVTTSLDDPLEDFAVNASGTLKLLEAVRSRAPDTPLVFASTNKVYGDLSALPMTLNQGRHQPALTALRKHGIGEAWPLDLCTPYGCSKGAADQYVLDYAKSYGLRTAVLRMSCIYGPRQLGTEDQGWVAHFLLRVLSGRQITIFGDGRQVRDILHVSDAVAAYRAVMADIDALSGRAFNLGGGPRNAVSLLDVLEEIEIATGIPPRVAHEPWRTGDQLYFVADTRALAAAVPWTAKVGWRDGLGDLAGWLARELDLTLPLRSLRPRMVRA